MELGNIDKAPQEYDHEADQVFYYMEVIERALNSERYDWAQDTLQGIHDNIEQYGRITANQRNAVDNIIKPMDPVW